MIGFLGIDSVKSRAFDALFRGGNHDGYGEDSLGPDDDRSIAIPREELNLLYGLTDAAATILILMEEERRSATDEESTPNEAN